MQSVRPDRSRRLGVFQAPDGVREAQRAQMQTFPCASAGIDASTLGLMVTVMHQQDSGSRPAAMAHSLGVPHKGHFVVSLGLAVSLIRTR